MKSYGGESRSNGFAADSWTESGAGWLPRESDSEIGGRASPMGGTVTLARTEEQQFRERVGFLILCVIGAYCGMRILVELKSILEPLLWALFLVMAWKPIVDGIERQIEWALEAIADWMCTDTVSLASCARRKSPGAKDEDPEGELQRMISDEEGERALTSQDQRRAADRGLQRDSCRDFDEDEEGDVFAHGGAGPRFRRMAARGLAVLTATLGIVGLLSCFGLLVMQSARRMRDHWDVYQKGAQQINTQLRGLLNKVPHSVMVQYQDVSADMFKAAQDMLYGLLGDIVNNVSSVLFGILLTMLYTFFWLCSPVPMDSSIDVMFRKYIMFKTLACFGYGMCVGILLAFLSIDLASVFALTTFVLNYVPEVGPFVAMVLPCPVILFDSRLERPVLVLLAALAGQLALKFAFGNIIEVKLIESDKKLRLHPVIILLSVGIFGYLWGPTGMLLSVPLMALVKISLFSELVPASYRDPILVMLEGDRNAPMKHGLRGPHQATRESGKRGSLPMRRSRAAPPG